MSNSGKSYAQQIMEAIFAAKEKLRGRIALPTLEVAVGVEAARKLRDEYVRSLPAKSMEEVARIIAFSNKIPKLMGHRVYVDEELTSNWYEIRMKVKKGVLE